MVSDPAWRKRLILVYFGAVLCLIGCRADTLAQRDLELFQNAFDESLLLETAELRPAVVGKPYSAPLKATGHYQPYRWSIVSGRLPDGLSLNNRGVLEGIPEIPEAATFVVKVVGALPTGARSEFGENPHIPSRMKQLTLVVKRASDEREP